jgi:hypothetical protein
VTPGAALRVAGSELVGAQPRFGLIGDPGHLPNRLVVGVGDRDKLLDRGGSEDRTALIIHVHAQDRGSDRFSD